MGALLLVGLAILVVVIFKSKKKGLPPEPPDDGLDPEPPLPPPVEIGKIYGKVVEGGDMSIPIPDVLVTAGSYDTFTDINGDFEMQVPIGDYAIILFKEGYGRVRWQRRVPSSGYHMGLLRLYLV